MKPKLTSTILVIFGAAVITGVIIYFTLYSIKQMLGFTFHDAFFATAPLSLGLLYLYLFLVLAFAGYAITSRFRSRLANCVLLLLLFVMELVCIKLNNAFAEAGGTIYPPLSVVPKELPQNAYTDGLFFYAQIIIVVLLIAVAILTGKNWDKRVR